MNQQQTKIRYGLILQGVLSQALSQAGIQFAETFQYAEGYEKPDFLIPNAIKPSIMVEVHQTEARNAFQMKTLRCIIAVTESKVHYGKDLIAINVLFGNPHTEVPQANVNAMCGIFDHNFFLIDQVDPDRLYELQETAMDFAGMDGISTPDAAAQVADEHPIIVDSISQAMQSEITKASVKKQLLPLWEMEKRRYHSLGPPPQAGLPTYYKRNLCRSLFFSDEQFKELLKTPDPNDLSPEVRQQLIRCKLATVPERMEEDGVEIDESFANFLADPKAVDLRGYCERRIKKKKEMLWFFQDIRVTIRREKMCEYVVSLITSKQNISAKIFSDLCNNLLLPVKHSRCWIADLLPLIVYKTHNYFNQKIYQDPEYLATLGNPYNNITIKSDRLGVDPVLLQNYADIAASVFFNEYNNENSPLLEIKALCSKLLEFRTNAAIKLQKMNPLYLALEEICSSIGLDFDYLTTQSIIGDLSGPQSNLGKYRLYHITDGKKKIIANALAPNENPGDKAKEWGARCQAMLYRFTEEGIKRSDIDAALMILDGIWDNEDIARLYRSGWTHVARLDQIEEKLGGLFDISEEKSIEMPESVFSEAAEKFDGDLNFSSE